MELLAGGGGGGGRTRERGIGGGGGAPEESPALPLSLSLSTPQRVTETAGEKGKERERGPLLLLSGVIHDGAGAIYVEKTLMQKYGDAFLSDKERRRRRAKGDPLISAFSTN